MSHTATPALTWDIFCHVIDNWGDLGVCWRLSADLASRGQQVRLWTDDPAPLAWMAPGALDGGWPGVQVHHWNRSDSAAPPTNARPGDVLIEAFGCHVPDDWVAHLQPAQRQAPQLWINLEYLSAERYVERCHRLPSPVLSGPLAGRQKWFYYPGFTPATGGLLCEPDLLQRQHAWAGGVDASPDLPSAPPEPQGPDITLFCYDPGPLPALLQHADLRHARWQVAPGRAATAFQQAATALPATARWCALPHTSQVDFDRTLWQADLNFVRGEDSLVRALWAGQAFVWHIYPQDDDAHHAKLDAFLDWLEAPADLRQMHATWNGLTDTALPPLDREVLARWREVTRAARQRLLAQPDLTTQLLGFVAEKR